MALTSDRDIRLLTKLADKRGFNGDITRIRKLVSAHVAKSHVSPQVALAFLAKEAGIGTRVYERTFDSAQQGQLREMRSKQSNAIVSVKQQKIQKTKKKIIQIVDYETDDPFIKGHIDEMNLAYTYNCYTSVFILARKIIENLLIDILRKKYPESIRENKELYFDIPKSRFKDFEEILKNLRNKKNDFGTENKAVEKLCNDAKKLKDDANDKTHSWYHLVTKKKEIDDLDLRKIMELIKRMEKVVGIR